MSDKKNNFENAAESYAERYKQYFEKQKKDNEGLGEFYNYFFSEIPEESADFLNSILSQSIKMGSGLAYLIHRSEYDPQIASALRSSMDTLKSVRTQSSNSAKPQEEDTIDE